MFNYNNENITNEISVNPRKLIIDILASAYSIELPSIESIQCSGGQSCTSFIINKLVENIDIFKNITIHEMDRMLSHEISLGKQDKYKYRLATLYGALGDYHNEIKVLKEISNIEENNFYYEKLAETLLKSNKIEGINILEKIDSTEAQNTLGLYYLQKKEIANAENVLLKALEKEPENYKVLSSYCVVCLLKCEYKSVIMLLRKIITNHEINEHVSFLFSLAYYFLGNLKKALKWSIIGVNINPLNKDIINLISHLSLEIKVENLEKYLLSYLDVKSDSFAIERLARFYFQNQKYGKSFNLLKSLLIENDKDPSIWNNLAITSFMMNDFDNISRYYLQAIKCMNNEIDITIIKNYFNYLSYKKEFKLLIDVFESLSLNTYIDLNYSNYQSIFTYYFRSLRNTGDIRKFQQMLLDIYNRYEEKQLRIAVLNELICFYSTYSIDEDLLSIYSVELESYISLIQDYSERMRLINNIIFGYLECGRQPSFKILQYFISNLNRNPYYNATYGLYYLKIGRLEKGIHFYEKAISYSDNLELIHSLKQKRDIETAKFFLFQNKKNKAIYYFEKVIKRNSNICPFYIDIAKQYLLKLK